MTKKKQLTLADTVVLSLVAERPMHGYQIVSELSYRDAKDWAPVSRPQVYYSVNKLAEMKLIAPCADENSSLGPERIQYQLTSKGKSELNNELSKKDWATHREPPRFLTWMALSTHLSNKETLKIISERRKFLTGEIKRERETLRAVGKDDGAMNSAAILMITLTLELFEAELKWLLNAEKTLSKVRK